MGEPGCGLKRWACAKQTRNRLYLYGREHRHVPLSEWTLPAELQLSKNHSRPQWRHQDYSSDRIHQSCKRTFVISGQQVRFNLQAALVDRCDMLTYSIGLAAGQLKGKVWRNVLIPQEECYNDVLLTYMELVESTTLFLNRNIPAVLRCTCHERHFQTVDIFAETLRSSTRSLRQRRTDFGILSTPSFPVQQTHRLQNHLLSPGYWQKRGTLKGSCIP